MISLLVGIDVAKDKEWDACIRAFAVRQTGRNTAQGHPQAGCLLTQALTR